MNDVATAPLRSSTWLLASIWLPLALGALAYMNTLAAGFVWDDQHLIVHNTLVRQPSPAQALLSDFWQEDERTDLYRPLISMSYYVEFRLWKLAPSGYHLANIAYHLAAALVVAWAARILLASDRGATVAGVVFAIHPIHTESVAFIAGRTDILATIFMVAAFALFARRSPWARGAPASSLAFFGGALLCKETALVLPVVLLVWEVTLGTERRRSPVFNAEGATSRSPAGAVAHRVAPYLGVAATYVALRWAVLGRPVSGSSDHTPLAARGLIAANALGEYLRLLVIPYPAAPDRLPDATLSTGTVATLAAIALLTAGALIGWRHSRIPAFTLAWFILTLLPASPLVPWRAPLVAERFLYIPSVALAWACGWVGERGMRAVQVRRRAVRIAAVGIGGGLVVAGLLWTAVRNLDWHDEHRLFTRMMASEPRSYLAPLNLGHLYMQSGDPDRAEVYLRRALALRPDTPAALLALGVVESQRGDHERAIQHAERARALAPGGDIVHAQLGTIYGVAGRHADAARSFREAIARNPRRLHPRANLVVALADLGRLTEAATALGDAERVVAAQAYADPGDLQTLADLRRRLAAQTRRSP